MNMKKGYARFTFLMMIATFIVGTFFLNKYAQAKSRNEYRSGTLHAAHGEMKKGACQKCGMKNNCGCMKKKVSPIKKGGPRKRGMWDNVTGWFKGLFAAVTPTKVMEVSDEDQLNKLLKADKPVVVKFHAIWCSVCKSMKQHDNAMAEKYDGKVKFVQLDIDKSALKALTQRHGVKGVPTYLFYKNGKVIHRHVGKMSRDVYDRQVIALMKCGM